jgi:hypothetical protein
MIWEARGVKADDGCLRAEGAVRYASRSEIGDVKFLGYDSWLQGSSDNRAQDGRRENG